MTAAVTWAAVLLAVPGLVAAVTLTGLRPERVRAVAVAGAVVLLAVASLAFVVPQLGAWRIGALLRTDRFSSVLPAFAAALWLLTVSVTPRTALDRAGLRRTALGTLLTTMSFLTDSLPLLVLLWAASVLTLLLGLSGREHARTRRLLAAYLGASTVILAGGAALLHRPDAWGGRAGPAGLGLVVAAALIRKGIVPFHAWVPAVFDRGRLGPAILFSSPQLGTYVVAVAVVPHASVGVLRLIAVLALVTAVYGAALAVVQRSARRACGYLFVSQSALVLAGMDCTSGEALTGALVLWLSSGLGFAGLGRCVLVLEARRGRLDLSKHHGGYERMPLLAGSFLLMGLSCIGFPGTLGFVGGELLVAGAVDAFPVLGFLTVAAGALTGIAVLRMYFSLFCGKVNESVHLRIRRREGWAFGLVVAFLMVTGVAPSLVISSRTAAGRQLLDMRRDAAGSRVPVRQEVEGTVTISSAARAVAVDIAEQSPTRWPGGRDHHCGDTHPHTPGELPLTPRHFRHPH